MEAFKSWGIILKLGAAGVMGNMGQWWSWEIAAGNYMYTICTST